tara:strand:+ start:1536 stop:2543 length:1008 start_codon:yes stop_codon:yes gene_type:complete
MKQVTIIAILRALGSTVTIPLEMLSAANDIARARKQSDKLLRIELIGLEHGSVVLSGGLTMQCTRILDQVKDCDLIFVPGIWGNPRASVNKNRPLVDWIRQKHRAGATICAVTTGVYFVAEAGILDGRAATTHWKFFDQFQAAYPQVKLQRKRFITSVDNIYCTGSVNAARDVMLHFIEQFYGDSIANEISRQFTHELKRSYESLLLSRDQQSTHHDEEIIKVQEWLQENYYRHIEIGAVADRFRMSVRSLNRRFKLATNTTPLQYLQDLRISHAKDLLKQSNLIISEVADRVGYQDASYFTGLFKKLNAVTPNEYRQLVRNKMFVAESNQRSIQ